MSIQPGREDPGWTNSTGKPSRSRGLSGSRDNRHDTGSCQQVRGIIIVSSPILERLREGKQLAKQLNTTPNTHAFCPLILPTTPQAVAM